MRLRKNEIKLAIMTGDLTQRAKKREFLAAKEFMTSLESPLFLIPGNHDVPLYNLFLRFFSPYKKFLRYMGPFAKNYFEDNDVAVYGLWTTDNFSIQSGRLYEKDVNELKERFNQVSPEKLRIIACHHPPEKQLQILKQYRPHFILWGHEHQSSVKKVGQTLLLASGTSASTRTRIEANSFNYISIKDNIAVIEIYRHSKALHAFEVIDRQEFRIS